MIKILLLILLVVSIIFNIIQAINNNQLKDEDEVLRRIEVSKCEAVKALNNLIDKKVEEINKLKKENKDLYNKISEYESGKVISDLRKEIENVVTMLSAILK